MTIQSTIRRRGKSLRHVRKLGPRYPVTSYSGRKQLGSKVRLAGKVESRERHQPRAATRHRWSGGATGGARGAGGGGKEVQPGFLSPRKLVLLLVNKSNTPVDPQVSEQVPQGLISPRRSHTDGRRPLRARLPACLVAWGQTRFHLFKATTTQDSHFPFHMCLPLSRLGPTCLQI